MYDNERNSGLNIRSIIGKIIFLAAFAFLLIWLLPKMPNMKPFYSNVFRENLSYMKDAAKGYYTNERLPQNIGEETKLTLQQLIDQSMIVPFVDKDGNSCDTYESYVSVIKNTTDYTLKINLVCNKEEKFVIETLGCYDKCQTGSCKEEIALEYQFKKVSKKNVTSCTCPKEYVDKKGVCYKSVTSSKIAAKAIYESDYNYVYEASKEANVLIGKVIEIPGSTSTYCPFGFTSIGNGYCSKAATVELIESTTWSCPSGYDSIGSGSTMTCKPKTSTTTCYACKPYTASEVAKLGSSYSSCNSTGTEYICTSGNCPGYVTVFYYRKCTTTSTIIPATPSTTTTKKYRCLDGGNLQGSSCIIEENSDTTPTTYKCEAGYTQISGSGKNIVCTKTEYTYECEKADDILVGTKCYRNVKGQFKYYECPQNQGYTIDGAWCYKTTEDTKNKTCSTYTKTVNSYKWSTNKTLSGWTLTGKTREVKNKI